MHDKILKNSSSAAINAASGDRETLDAYEELTGENESLMLLAQWLTMDEEEKSFYEDFAEYKDFCISHNKHLIEIAKATSV